MIVKKIKQPVVYLCMVLTCSILACSVQAQSIYISYEFNVGLHEDRSIDSPILILLKSGTELEVIKREDSFTYVSSQDGARGWIENSYLSDNPLGTHNNTEEVQSLVAQLEEAREQIKQFQNATPSSDPADATTIPQSEQDTLQEAFNREQIRAGELQVQLAELRKRVGQDNDNAALYAEIEGLQRDKKTLEIQIAGLLENEGIADPSERNTRGSADSSWKTTLIYYAITMFLGLCIGVYIMDVINRRRHAGLRL